MSTQKTLIKFALTCALLVIAYIPTILWMIERWDAADGYYSHGYLIPLVSAFLIWSRRGTLKNIKPVSDVSGIWLIAGALSVNVICAALKIYFISGFSMVFALSGLVLFFFGREMLRKIAFPMAFY